MCPFLNDDDYAVENEPLINKREELRSAFFKDDKKFFVIGGVAAVVAFCVIGYVMYSSSRPINLEELPVIHAETSPFKVKPKASEQVKHQDKTVYDNISGDKRIVVEKIAPQPEEVLSIPDIEVEETLSDEEKKNIIQAFDELAPEKEYKINYVKKDEENKTKSAGLVIVEDQQKPPLNLIKEEQKVSKSKKRLKDIIETNVSTRASETGAKIMVQVASVLTKPAAEAEYKRILYKNKFLKYVGKKILKVDFGGEKGIRYRIQVGPFKNRNGAQKVIASLKKNGFSAYIAK